MTIPEPADWDIEDPETGNKLRVAWMAGYHAAFILTGSEGFPLTPGQCREAAARLVAHADRMDPNPVADWLTAQYAVPHIHWAPHGGQWTRDDFARLDIHPMSTPTTVLDEVAAWLNAHQPKPVPYDQGGWPKPGAQVTANRDEVDAALRSELMGAYGQRDRLRILLASAADERDAAVARAEKAEDRVRALETAPARSTWCPKILLELLRAQLIYSPDEVTGDAIQTLDRVIAQHRPVGPDGKHGDRHTASCGCEDLGAVYPTVEVQARAAVADTKLEDESVNHAYWVANRLGCHVDYLDGLTLVEMAERVAEKAERERDEALDRAGNLAVEVQTGLCLGGLPRVTRADVEKAIGSCHVVRRFLDDVTMVSVPDAIDAVCKELGIEAEQVVDPVEAKARELFAIAYPNIAWEACDPAYPERARELARHVLGQEADQ